MEVNSFFTPIWLIVLASFAVASTTGATGNVFTYPKESLACKEYDGIILDCSYRKLTGVPTFNSNYTKTLDLNYNSLKTITDRPFRNLLSLRYLYLADNQISVINNDAFYGLSQLESLYLQNNVNYLHIIGAPFEQTPSLVQLDLSNNRIHDLSSTTFNGLWNLQTLDLSHNLIQTMPGGIFNHLQHLRLLDLSENFMKIIPSHAIASLHSLRTFDMNWSLITLPYFGQEFSTLHNLTEIMFAVSNDSVPTILTEDTFRHLGDTQLKHLVFVFPWNAVIDKEIFNPLKYISDLEITGTADSILALQSLNTELENLTLDDLSLTTINATTFIPMWNLKSLKILGKRYKLEQSLQRIEDASFQWFPSLKELSLKGNQLEYIDMNAFAGLNQLDKLDLSENSLATLPVAALTQIF
ncbi:uncharacterized protein [Amphiura filiformis]|uniref:uncharacterized protein n=1 Tax=Amphiura filiformis TaxID=82378 RepID=UPI003B2189B6